MKITVIDICKRLTVSPTQVRMAVYSGALPNPDEYEEWDADYIESFLKNWHERIKRRNKDVKEVAHETDAKETPLHA